MSLTPPYQPNTIPLLLDGADKIIKAIAVAIGGAWTYWNYKKSRTFAEKLELVLTGSVFLIYGDAFVDITIVVKNLRGQDGVLINSGRIVSSEQFSWRNSYAFSQCFKRALHRTCGIERRAAAVEPAGDNPEDRLVQSGAKGGVGRGRMESAGTDTPSGG
jgi:hypothetical protein